MSERDIVVGFDAKAMLEQGAVENYIIEVGSIKVNPQDLISAGYKIEVYEDSERTPWGKFLSEIDKKGVEEKNSFKVGIQRLIEDSYFVRDETLDSEVVRVDLSKFNGPDAIRKVNEMNLKDGTYIEMDHFVIENAGKELPGNIGKSVGVEYFKLQEKGLIESPTQMYVELRPC